MRVLWSHSHVIPSPHSASPSLSRLFRFVCFRVPGISGWDFAGWVVVEPGFSAHKEEKSVTRLPPSVCQFRESAREGAGDLRHAEATVYVSGERTWCSGSVGLFAVGDRAG